jgi:hypothetical protein
MFLRDVPPVYVLTWSAYPRLKSLYCLRGEQPRENRTIRPALVRFAAPCRGYEPHCLEITPQNNLPILVTAPRKVNFTQRGEC